MGANVGSGQSAHGLTGAQILARLTAIGAGGSVFADNVFEIIGSSDATKIAMFEVDGFTTGTTRTFTLPNASITVAGSASALTSGRVPFATTGGLLTDSAALTWSGTSFATTATGAASFSTAGGYTSTVATGTAPFTATSTTACPNLNASLLLGSTWAIPGSIGSTTPAAGAFTTLAASGAVSFTGSSLTLGSNAGTSETFQFNSAASQQRGFQFQTAGVNLWSVVTSNTESGSDAGCALTYVARTDAGVTIDVPLTLTRAAGTAVSITRPLSLTAASSGLTIAITTGTSLVVSSTAAASSATTGCATFAGGVGVSGKLYFGSTLTAAVNSGSTINLDLSDTAASRTVAVFRVNTSATAHTTAALMDVVSSASTSSDKMVRVRANSVDVWTVAADGSCTFTGPLTFSSLTSGRVPFAGTAGLLGDSAALTFSVPSFANLVVGTNAQSGSSFVTFNNASGFSKSFLAQTGGVNRWQLSVADNTAESGSNAGSNFNLTAYTDAGASIDSPLTIARIAGGTMAISRPVTMASTLDVVGTGTFGNGTAAATVIVNGLAATARQFVFRTAGSNRWAFQCDSTAESGSNAGSNFVLGARDDSGVAIDSPIAIARVAAGAITMARPVTLSTASTGLTISVTTGTSLTVSSTNASAISCSGGYIGAGRVVSSSATAGIGYATGAGGTVTQATNKATTVVLNAVCGTITLNNGALAGGGNIAFGFTNSAIAATDVVLVYHDSVGTLGAYGFAVASGSGTATIAVRNMTGGSLSEAIVLRFVVIKAVTS